MSEKKDSPLLMFRILGRALRPGLVLGVMSLGLTLGASQAKADFRLCNKTPAQVVVAIGYKDPSGWVSEGWWNVDSERCSVVVNGPLASRYYYIYALDNEEGGAWNGTSFMCTRDKEFTINGVEDCVARGFERRGFVEVDTLDQLSWTVQLTDRQSVAGIGGR